MRPFDVVESLVAAGVLAPEDVEPVEILAERFGERDPWRLFGLVCAAAAPGFGHAGARLAEMPELLLSRAHDASMSSEARALLAKRPAAEAWVSDVARSPMVGRASGENRPFVAVASREGPLLMTHRAFREEERLAECLVERWQQPDRDVPGLDTHLTHLFGADVASPAARAVRIAARRSLAIVTGGPGTGKTYSVKRLLAALLIDDPALVIRLAAPTGKAAARMEEALAERDALDLPEPVRAAFDRLTGETIHRLIGLSYERTPRHDRKNPITADVVVVDEVSMVDASLMRRLVEAVPPTARLVLLGDPDQLPSVDAGRVLADLVASERLSPVRVAFQGSRRFAHVPQIAHAAACLQSMPPRAVDPAWPEAKQRALDALTLSGGGPLEWIETPAEWGGRVSPSMIDALARLYRDGYLPVLKSISRDADESALRGLLDALDGDRVLTLVRKGPSGSESLDEALSQRLGLGSGLRPVHGRPVLVTRNSYELDLFNGDVGIVVERAGGFFALFPSGRRGVRLVPYERLPMHEGALAMTVHKSQGSQFSRVTLVMTGRASPVATLEVVYTGLTRAKDGFRWLGSRSEMGDAIDRRILRWSALADRIDQHPPG